MKYLFIIISLYSLSWVTNSAYAQTFIVPRAKMHYVGELPSELLPVGKEWRFEQRCDTSIEAVIQNGSIIFENSTMFGIKCFHEFTLREGIVVKQVIEVERTKKILPFLDSLKSHIPFKNPEFTRLKKGYILNENIQYEDGRVVHYSLAKSKGHLIVVISATRTHAVDQRLSRH